MDPLNDHDRSEYDVIEDALETYPLEAPPAGLHTAVMNRVRADVVVPRFRLRWLDYALSLLAAMMAGLLYMLGSSVFSSPWFFSFGDQVVSWGQVAFPDSLFLGLVLLGSLALSLVGVLAFTKLLTSRQRFY